MIDPKELIEKLRAMIAAGRGEAISVDDIELLCNLLEGALYDPHMDERTHG